MSLFKEKQPPFIHSLATCLCIIFVSSPCDPVGRDGCCGYFHFVDEDTEAQRPACSAQLIKGKARPGTPSSRTRPPPGNLLCKVADVPISRTACLKRLKGKGRTVHEALELKVGFEPEDSFRLSVLLSSQPPSYTAHTPCPPFFSCPFPEEISKGLPSAMASPHHSRLGLPSDCGFSLLTLIYLPNRL